ncbi:MAG: Uma2 family endonuclease [Acidobacteria bacterium]|nr:Uma2 family endonuclease [Acidobacteriota bacterium]
MADAKSEIPLEYREGEVFPAFDASPAHARLVIRLGRALDQRLDGTPSATYAALRIRVTPVQYVYPDIAIVSGDPAQISEKDTSVSNPKVIFEILSPSTQDYDYGGKFLLYRQVPSIQEYVLVWRDQPRAEVFRRAPQEKWILSSFQGLGATLILESLELRLPLSELYA